MKTYRPISHKTGLKKATKLTVPKRTYVNYPKPGIAAIDGNPVDLELTLRTASIDLSWDNGSTNEDGIVIEKSTDGSPFAAITTVPHGTELYVDKDVEIESEYSYRLLSYKGNSTSLFSNIATMLFDPIDGDPSLLAATGGQDKIDLSWTNGSTNEDGIDIERSIDNDVFEKIESVDPGVAVFEDDDVEQDVTYYYRVIAFKSTSYSKASNVASASLITGD